MGLWEKADRDSVGSAGLLNESKWVHGVYLDGLEAVQPGPLARQLDLLEQMLPAHIPRSTRSPAQACPVLVCT